MIKIRVNIILMFLLTISIAAQTVTKTQTVAEVKKDTVVKESNLTKFNNFNKKAEAFFKVFPVPIYGYSTEAGNTYGLAKFNVISLSKKDTVSKPSKLTGLATFSSLGKVNVVLGGQLYFHENKYQILSYVYYQKQPEYIFGIGNDVTKADVESVNFDRVKVYLNNLMKIKENLYLGIPIEFANYFNMEIPTDSFLIQDNITGVTGGYDVGTGFSGLYDTRKNPYNPQQGAYCLSSLIFHPKFLGSTYQFTRFVLDMRKYYNPWLKHIIAMQAYTSNAPGNTPFYDLSLMGGSEQMRGYYQGAYRDKTLVDAQVEYRAPVWNIFGVVGFIGTGRVFESYKDLSFETWRLSYGGGLRIMVDSKHQTNLRMDMGFGEGGSLKGAYISFGEAF